jgi:hypothetical protein
VTPQGLVASPWDCIKSFNPRRVTSGDFFMGVVKRLTKVMQIFYKIYGWGNVCLRITKIGFAGEEHCLMADAGPLSIWGDGG